MLCEKDQNLSISCREEMFGPVRWTQYLMICCFKAKLTWWCLELVLGVPSQE